MDIEVVFSQLTNAKNYLEVFGECEDGVKPEVHIKKIYRRLARKVHPDRYTTEAEKQKAQEAFKLLGNFHEAAKKAATKGNYGVVPKLIIKTRAKEFEVGELFTKGEIADLYEAQARGANENLIFKIARLPVDNELLAKEAVALRTLRSPDGDAALYPFFPELLDSFTYNDGRSVHRTVNVTPKLEGWYNLEEIREHYPKGISPLNAVWIWRRLLWLLGYAHRQGLLHLAVLPNHIMILPEKHGVMLVDWCYSQKEDSGSFTPAKAISAKYRDWYPKEVTEKLSPTPGTDIYLAVRTLAYLMGGEKVDALGPEVPRGIKAFLRGCLQENQKVRPQDAWELLGEFDELLERLGPPFFPRKFHVFTVPD